MILKYKVSDNIKFNLLFCEGAPEILLEKCSSYLNSNGNEKPLVPKSKNLFEIFKIYGQERVNMYFCCHQRSFHHKYFLRIS